MRNQFSRSFYTGERFTRVARNDDLGVEVYRDNNPKREGSIVLMGFAGKRQKPDWHYRFSSEERAAKHVDEWLRGLKASQQYKTEQKEKKKAFKHTLKVGDLLVSSWGYEQTNIDYYQVTALIGSTMVEVREISQSRRDEGFMQGRTTPVPDCFIGAPKKYKVQEGNCIKIASYAYAHPCTATDTRIWTSYA